MIPDRVRLRSPNELSTLHAVGDVPSEETSTALDTELTTAADAVPASKENIEPRRNVDELPPSVARPVGVSELRFAPCGRRHGLIAVMYEYIV